MKDYYKILEVSSSASEEEIKKSYRNLCKKYHPDLSKESSDIFLEIQEAYETLSDPEKRKAYDKFGEDKIDFIKEDLENKIFNNLLSLASPNSQKSKVFSLVKSQLDSEDNECREEMVRLKEYYGKLRSVYKKVQFQGEECENIDRKLKDIINKIVSKFRELRRKREIIKIQLDLLKEYSIKEDVVDGLLISKKIV